MRAVFQKVYTLTPVEVGSSPLNEQYVVLDLGSHGRITLRGLTLPEARELGALLYRPLCMKITLTKEEGPTP